MFLNFYFAFFYVSFYLQPTVQQIKSSNTLEQRKVDPGVKNNEKL